MIANPIGGFLVTERGAGCTWAENAYFYRLTPWHNDPVCDPVSDALYLQDEEQGSSGQPHRHQWTAAAPYRVTHGAGCSTFEHEHDGIRTRTAPRRAEPMPP